MRISGIASPMRLGALALGLASCVPSAQAGFFERLFGIESEPEAPRYYQPAQPRAGGYDYHQGYGEPLDFTVRKRPRERAVKRERRERRDRAAPPAAAVETAGPIDPVQNPDWYLQDPTLRRGDIVVLKNEVLVFQGGRLPFSRANFASLSQSDLPKDERERLAHMAGLKPVPAPRTAVASAGQ